MPYGTIKVDNIIYTKGGVDTTLTVSGIVDSLSGAISVTGSISGASVSAPTGTFTTLSGNTTAGTTATFVTGVFTTSLSGATITGNTGQFSNITGVSGVFTTRISGATITGNTGQFSSITGISGVFTSVSGTTFTVTSGVFASGTAAAPSVSVGTTTNGLYSSATNEVALATNSSSRLVVDASGNVNIDAGTFYVDAVNNRVGVGETSLTNRFHVKDAQNITYSSSNTLAGGVLAYIKNASTTDSTDATIRLEATGSSNIAAASLSAVHTGDGSSAFTVGTRSAAGNVTEKMRLDASGNLGLGVTPSAWNSVGRVIEVSCAGNGLYSGLGANNFELISNAYFSTNWKYGQNGTANRFNIGSSDGSFRWYTAPSGTAGNAITFTQAMTLDASGNLGVGNTSPISYDADFRNLVIGASGSTGISIISGTASNGTLAFGDGTGAANYRGYVQYSHASDSLVLATAASPRISITSGGLVGIGTTETNGLILGFAPSVQQKNGINYVISSPYTYTDIWGAGTAGGWAGRIRFWTSNNAVPSNPTMTLDESGRLLVGTDSDSGGALLQVNGDRIRVATAKTPASASATGTTGEVCWDANYIYVCTATNTWKRSALSTW